MHPAADPAPNINKPVQHGLTPLRAKYHKIAPGSPGYPCIEGSKKTGRRQKPVHRIVRARTACYDRRELWRNDWFRRIHWLRPLCALAWR